MRGLRKVLFNATYVAITVESKMEGGEYVGFEKIGTACYTHWFTGD